MSHQASPRGRWACRWETAPQPLYKHAPNPWLSGSTRLFPQRTCGPAEVYPGTVSAALLVLAPNWKQPVSFSALPRLPLIKLLARESASTSAATAISDRPRPLPEAIAVPGMQVWGSEHPWTWGGGVISSRTMSKAEQWWVPKENETRRQSHHLLLTGGDRVGGGGMKMPITWSVRPSATCPECWPSTAHVEPASSCLPSAGAPFPPFSLRGAICSPCPAPRKAAGIISAFLSNPSSAIHSSQFSPHLLLGDPTPNLFQLLL